MARVYGNHKKRILIVFFVLGLLLTMLSLKLAWIQIVKGEEYTDKAIAQQTSDIPIEAKRGVIYDRNGKELATSATCYSVWARPPEIANTYTTEEKLDDICSKLAVVLDMKAKDVKEKLQKDQALIRIDKYLDRETCQKVRDLEIYGIEIAEDTKRYYPLGNFASQLLGSVNDDNVGRSGVEQEYNEYLSGVAGRWIKNTDINGNALAYGKDQYYQAENGLNVVMTLDEVLQHFAENAIANGLKETNADRVMCLVMDPKTGDILAMATNPGFDPNDATEPPTKAAKDAYEKMDAEKQTEYLSGMWRNPLVSDTYEPGSTFKLLTVSAALEEGITTPDDHYYCNVGYQVPGTGWTLHCWSDVPHRDQSLTQAVGNSCNPVMMQLAMKMGISPFYDYLEMFGITANSLTYIDLPAEAMAQIQLEENIGNVELATISYGHGIAVTPIQLACAVSAIGNNGVLMQPRVVKELTDDDGNTVKEFETKKVRKVISSKTAKEVRKIMEYVVAEGSGSNASVAGYRIGGKTGTADKPSADGGYSSDTYSSFIGMAPMDDPQLTVLVIVDSPKGVQYGSTTAAPIAKEFFENALPYLGIAPNYTKEEERELKGAFVYVPDVTGKKYSKAVSKLQENNLKYKAVPSEGTKDFKVVAQYPKAGEKVKKGTKVYLYRE